MPGAGAKRKGSTGERELVNVLKEAGIEAQRVPLSGSVDGYAGDVYLPGLNKRVEVKRRKNGLKTVYDWLAHNPDVSYLAFRIDRQPWIIAMPLDEFISLLRSDGDD